MVDDGMYTEALEAVHNGEKDKARELLSQLLKSDPNNADYWVWMSVVVVLPRERIYCLQEALKKDPGNQAARRGLTVLGVIPPDEKLMPPPGLIRRKWQGAATTEVVYPKRTQNRRDSGYGLWLEESYWLCFWGLPFWLAGPGRAGLK
jgi:hypothetical protein